MSNELLSKKCVSCEGTTPPMGDADIQKYISQVHGWAVSDTAPKKIRKEFELKNFKEAMAFINKVAEIAEAEGHHPDIYIFYNKVRLELWTHAANGLTENDFIIAAKIDATLTSD